VKQVAKRAVIGRPKLAYFAEYHELHERVNCVIYEMENAKKRMLLRTAVMPMLVVDLYFDANVVQ